MRSRRPTSIRWFEALAYLSLVLSTANTFIVYAEMQAALTDSPSAVRGAVVTLWMITLAVYTPLIWLAARRGTDWARWILVALIAISFVRLPQVRAILEYGGPSAVISLIQFPLSAILLWLLFRADSRRWFAGDREVEPEIFQ